MAESPVIEKIAAGKTRLAILGLVLTPIISLFFGYGGYKFTAGADQQRIINLEYKVEELQNQALRDKDELKNYTTNAVLMAYLDGFRHTLESLERSQGSLQSDVRSLINRR